MGGIDVAWLAVWVLSPDWPSRTLQVCDFFRRLGEAAAPVGGMCGPCPDFAFYTLAFALQLREITENLSQGSTSENINKLSLIKIIKKTHRGGRRRVIIPAHLG